MKSNSLLTKLLFSLVFCGTNGLNCLNSVLAKSITPTSDPSTRSIQKTVIAQKAVSNLPSLAKSPLRHKIIPQNVVFNLPPLPPGQALVDVPVEELNVILKMNVPKLNPNSRL